MNLKFFRQPRIALLFALSLLFVSCSDSIDSVEPTNFNTNKSLTTSPYLSLQSTDSDFQFQFNQAAKGDLKVSGNIYYDAIKEAVDVEYDFSDGIDSNPSIQKIDSNIYEVSGLGETFKVEVLQDVNKVNLLFSYPDREFLVDASGIGITDPVSLPDPNITVQPQVCGWCIGVAIIVVGGAYCAWKQNTASDNCLQAYRACAQNHKGGCSYQFRSTTCGGECTVEPR